MLFYILTIISVFGTLHALNPEDYTEAEAKEYVKQLNEEFLNKWHEKALAEWNYESNLTDSNEAYMLAVTAEVFKFQKSKWEVFRLFPRDTYEDEDLRRQLNIHSTIVGQVALAEEKNQRFDSLVTEMTNINNNAVICDYNNKTRCDLSLEPDLSDILATSRNEPELKYVWTEYHEQTAKGVKPLYEEYVTLSNEASVIIGFNNTAADWIYRYETDNLIDLVENLWLQLKPFYQQLHAYVRTKLRLLYGEEIVSKCGPIPAHLLSNMWAHTWTGLIDITNPFNNVTVEDVSANLVEQGYTPLKMFKMAEEFYVSINLDPMVSKFWENSIIEKPIDRDIICSPSSWNLFDGNDFRIKMCTEVTLDDLTTIYHEMGHTENFMAYKDQPYIYQDGANSAFFEAIGDTISLSVSTPEFLNQIGLLKSYTQSYEADINSLFLSALDRIAFLPFGLLLELWRFSVFDQTTPSNRYNEEYWRLRRKYQGVIPPVERTENDFDACSKYHIVSDSPYLGYFLENIIQFQFYESLCVEAGQYDSGNPESKPLHRCSLYKSVEAGNLFKSILKLGKSKPWQVQMEILTGQRNMDTSSLLNYYKPLIEWLEQENSKNNECIGWDET